MGLEIKLLAALALVAAILFGFGRFVASERAAGAAECRAAQAKVDAAETQRRLAARSEVNSEAQRMGVRRHDEALSLDAAAGRLRDRFAAAVRPVSDPAAPAGCEAASAATGVCSELLGKADERLRILAATADARRDAGLSCERSYDSLIR